MGDPTGSVHLTATYRLQVRNGLTLDGVLESGLLDHLDALGVSHLYLSPLLEAVPDSTHGYDVVDPTRVDPAIGGDVALARLAAACAERGMGIVVDIVPNHMAIGEHNRWWWDVLANGRSSRFADYFDIDWDPPEERLRGLILLPVLSDHLGREVDRHAFGLQRHGGEIRVVHPSVVVPLEASSTASIILDAAERLDPSEPSRLELRRLAERLGALPDPSTDRYSARSRRQEEVPDLLGAVALLCAGDAAAADALDRVLDEVAGDADRLDDLLTSQPYRLTRWQEGVRDLAYRRFFDVTDLVALRMDRADVFEATHPAILGWVRDGLVDGLRVDHPDGLRDPAAYFAALRAHGADGWLVAEKILESGERLPPNWEVDGTTGYEVAELIGRLHLDDAGRPVLTELAASIAGAPLDATAAVVDATRSVLRDVLGADLNRLTGSLLAACEQSRRFRDFSRHELHESLVEVIAHFPVYRTYTLPGEKADPTRGRTGVARRRRCRRRRARARPRAVRPHLPAVVRRRRPLGPERRVPLTLPTAHRTGQGQGQGGHRVVSRGHAAASQRGRFGRRSMGVVARGVP